ncbi:L,D-transpeptidase scaffold domain-containing protein [Rhizorhabdus argentea]|uniref:L,D-transpeptidase family protein n=1 Tax=Rhizorhabdus argentea TaxID=1387174 RepID=UPI0030EB6646
MFGPSVPRLIAIALGFSCSLPAPATAPTARSAATSTKARQVAAAIRDRAAGRIKRFYASRGFWPLWASSGTIGPEADLLLEYLETADRDGLKPSSYDAAGLRTLIEKARGGDPQAGARAELALSEAFARYVADVRRVRRVKITYLDDELKPRTLAADTVLRAAGLQSSLKAYVGTMGWMSPHYLRFRNLLARAMATGNSAEAIRRIRLNLDRARLLPGPWTRHVVVDAASARLWYYEKGKPQGMMRVVVGTAETPTPMLAGMVRYAVLNPYWNVPVDLARKRIAPKILAGASPASMRIEALSDWSASAHRLDPAEVDWDAVASGRRAVRLRQLPGGNNAMGHMKFIFPNDLGIYLHDTPDRRLLTKTDRHFSNGCIRLENAPALGRWLFGRPMVAASRKPEQAAALPAPVPVYLTYFTATPTERGVGFFNDVYGRDH